MNDFSQAQSEDSLKLIVYKNGYYEDYIKNNPVLSLSPGLCGNFTVASADRTASEYITRDLLKNGVCSEASVFGLLDFRGRYTEAPESKSNYPLTGKSVLLGFVDTGIDYTKDIFKYKNKKSRIAGIYDQTIEGSAPYDFNFGTEYTQQQINLALVSPEPFSVVPSRDTVGHGTFLASVAAGGGEAGFSGAAPEAELLVVKLRSASLYYRKEFFVPAEQENAYLSCDIMLGIEYIIRKARELNRPAVICLGLGSNDGGHDGYSLYEEYLYNVSLLPGICLCAAAGNECLAGHHFSGIFEDGENIKSASLRINQPSDVYMTLWSDIENLVSVSLETPLGEASDFIIPKTATKQTVPLHSGACLAEVKYDFPVRGSGAQNVIIKIYRAVPGVWSVKIKAVKNTGGSFNIWLPVIGMSSPGLRFETPDKNQTIVIPGTGKGVITCAACSADGRALYPMSSFGPTRLDKISPDIAAPGIEIPGIYPDAPGLMSGTGVSTSLAAGQCALLMQWGILNKACLSTLHIRAYLIQGASRKSSITYPNNQWGYGVIDIIKSLEIAEAQSHPATRF